MAYLQECLQRFENLPSDLKEKFGSLEAFEKIEEIENYYEIDLKFAVILLAIGELAITDLPAYLQEKYDLAEEDALEIADKLIDKIFYFDFLGLQEIDEEDSSLNLKDIIPWEEVLDIFKNNFARFLKETNSSYLDIERLNKSVFFHLSVDGLRQEEMAKALIDNNERITKNKIVVEEKEISPTISNWLRDFFKHNGAGEFNDLALLEYLNRSKNAKALIDEEKNVLRKMLKAYYNINFFPESMENILVDDWQIISSSLSEAKKTPIVSEVKDAVDKNNDYKEKELPVKETVNIQISAEEKRLLELKDALPNYPSSSLEYKAIKQEITSLEKKTKK